MQGPKTGGRREQGVWLGTKRRLFRQYNDGVIIYLDGVGVGSDNMPGGDEAFDLAALGRVDGERLVRRIPLAIPDGLPPGKHVLAISLHNAPFKSPELRIAGITLVEVE